MTPPALKIPGELKTTQEMEIEVGTEAVMPLGTAVATVEEERVVARAATAMVAERAAAG